MPKRKPAQDDNSRIVRAVERVTGTGPVRGEDLLPRRLAKEFREAKAKAREKKPNGGN